VEADRGHAGMADSHLRRLVCYLVGPAGGIAVYRGAVPGSARESPPRGERVDAASRTVLSMKCPLCPVLVKDWASTAGMGG
jgi:hypothetical protein